MGILDFKGLNTTLLGQARSMLAEWLPGGRVINHQYCCGDIQGGPGNSFQVSIRTGVWKEFANSEISGGDLISLYAKIHKISDADAYKRLADMYRPTSPSPIAKPEPAEVKLIRPPEGTHLPKFNSKPTAIYRYKDRMNRVLFLVTRFGEVQKRFVAWSWSESGRWVKKAWPSPRPIYNLPRVHKYPDRRILICEGEKATEAAHKLCGDKYNVITWPFGSNSWSKVDWSPIYQKFIVIWPDADKPGRECALEIAKHLHGHCQGIKIIDTADLSGGKDAADFDFKNWDEFKAWAGPRAKDYPFIEKPKADGGNSPTAQGTKIIDQSNPEMLPPEGKVLQLKPKKKPPNQNQPYIDEIDFETVWTALKLPRTGKQRKPIANLDTVARITENDPFIQGRIVHDVFLMTRQTTIDWADVEELEPEEYIQTYQANESSLIKGKTSRLWTDSDCNHFLKFIHRQLGITNIKLNDVYTALGCLPSKYTRNIAKETFGAVVWDGVPRLPTLMTNYFGATDPPGNKQYLIDVSLNFGISMAARVFRPGCKVDNMVILEGDQAAKKSTALSVLGGDLYTDSKITIGTKDAYIMLNGYFLVEMSELDSFAKASDESIKQFLSTSTDNYRDPYGRSNSKHPRQSIFVGTTNKTQYLTDPTGNRRIWPVACGNPDIEALTANRPQILAECAYRYKDGQKWWSEPHGAKEEQAKRMVGDIWDNQIAEWLAAPKRQNLKYFKMEDIANDALGIEIGRMENRREQTRIGNILRAMKFKKGNRRINGIQTKVWYRQE